MQACRSTQPWTSGPTSSRAYTTQCATRSTEQTWQLADVQGKGAFPATQPQQVAGAHQLADIFVHPRCILCVLSL